MLKPYSKCAKGNLNILGISCLRSPLKSIYNTSCLLNKLIARLNSIVLHQGGSPVDIMVSDNIITVIG